MPCPQRANGPSGLHASGRVSARRPAPDGGTSVAEVAGAGVAGEHPCPWATPPLPLAIMAVPIPYLPSVGGLTAEAGLGPRSHGGSAPPWGRSPLCAASDAHGSSPSISPRPSPRSYTLANRTPTRHPSHRPPRHESGHVLTCAAWHLLQSRARTARTAGSPLGGCPFAAILRSRP